MKRIATILAPAVLLLASLTLMPTAHAVPDDAAFFDLGPDAGGDGFMEAAATGDDITHVWVASDFDTLYFKLDLGANALATTGDHCWLGAFEYGGGEWLSLVCAVMVAGQPAVAGPVEWSTHTGSSRGETAVSTAEFVDADTIVISTPFDSFGGKAGDSIDDMFAMTYFSRGMLVGDTVPDAKSDKDAGESLGSHVLGSVPGGEEEPAEPVDTDGDGFTDEEEDAAGTDPNDAESYPGSEDADGNDTADNSTADPGTNDTADNSTMDDEHAHGNHTEDEGGDNATLDSGHDDHDHRDVMAGMGFLTPAAEALGMDSAFNEYAEPVMLGVLILILILVVILLIAMLNGSGPISLDIEPKRLTVVAGQTAQFNLNVRNRKGASREVQAMFTGANWPTGLEVRPEEGNAPAPLTQPDLAAGFELTAKGQPGDVAAGRLSVQVPRDLPVGTNQKVDLTVTPLDEDGLPMTKKARTVHAQVTAEVPEENTVTGLSIGDVMHEPALPRAGQQVTTSCQIENAGRVDADLRVALLVDGATLDEQPVSIPAGGSVEAVFPWKASGGRNNVKVQVYAA